jgi:hypothetical protein
MIILQPPPPPHCPPKYVIVKGVRAVPKFVCVIGILCKPMQNCVTLAAFYLDSERREKRERKDNAKYCDHLCFCLQPKGMYSAQTNILMAHVELYLASGNLVTEKLEISKLFIKFFWTPSKFFVLFLFCFNDTLHFESFKHKFIVSAISSVISALQNNSKHLTIVTAQLNLNWSWSLT